MHLASWEIIKKSLSQGGLQTRDPFLDNMALGEKLIWQLYVDKYHPVSKIFRMKYLKGGSLRNITSSNTPLGTTIWNSCRRGLGKFNQQLYRIPCNGKKILLWEDKISGNPALSSVILLAKIMNWTINKGLLLLADIFSWDSVGN